MQAFSFYALTSLAILLAAGCSSPKAVNRSIEATNPAPSSGGVSQATLEFSYEPPYQTAHGGHGGRVMYVLDLHGVAPGRVVLEALYIGGSPGDISGAEPAAMRKGPERMDFARDGHALAIARAGETKRRLVAFDAGPAPLYCRHVTFGTAADPFAGAPSTRDLALAILKTEKGGAHDSDSSSASEQHFESELAAAVRYACAHREDTALREATASAIVLRGSRLFSTSVVEPIVDCAGDLAHAYVEPRNILVAAVTAQEPELLNQVSRAAEALARGDDARSAEAIATALGAPAASRVIANDTSCWMRAALAWSLAKITGTRASATPSVEAALAQVALAPEPCTEGYGAIAARIYAVRALSGLGSAHALEPLRALAKDTCATPIDTWPTTYERSNEAIIGASHKIACWAQAGIAHAGNAGTSTTADAGAPRK